MSEPIPVVGFVGRRNVLTCTMEAGAPACSPFAMAVAMADTSDQMPPKVDDPVSRVVRRLLMKGNGRLGMGQVAYADGRAVMVNSEVGLWLGPLDQVDDFGLYQLEGSASPHVTLIRTISDLAHVSDTMVAVTGDLVLADDDYGTAIVITVKAPLIMPDDLEADQDLASEAAAMFGFML